MPKTLTAVNEFAPNNGHGPFAGFHAVRAFLAGANDCAGPNGATTVPYPSHGCS